MVRKFKKKTLAKNALDEIFLGLATDMSFEKYVNGAIQSSRERILKDKENIENRKANIKTWQEIKRDYKKNRRKFIEKYASDKLQNRIKKLKSSKK